MRFEQFNELIGVEEKYRLAEAPFATSSAQAW